MKKFLWVPILFVSAMVMATPTPEKILVPGEQYMLYNVATGSWLTASGTLTSQEQRAANWRIIAREDAIGEGNYVVYSGANVLQLSNSGFGGWSTAFTGKANTTVIRPSTTTEGAFKFSYQYLLDTRYMAVNTASGNLMAGDGKAITSDWMFVATSHPEDFSYRLMSINRDGGSSTYTIAYRSCNVDGSEVWLSGWLAVPTASEGGKCSADHVLLSTHYTMCKNSEVPSQTQPYDAFTYTLSTNKPVMIEPDYLGYGITSNLEHPYCAPEIMAENSVDMLFAAHDLLRDLHRFDVSDGNIPTYGIGYSQGGAIILACQKYVETSEKVTDGQRKAINWIRTCAGAGPYNSLATISQYMYQDKLSMPCAAPLLVMGMVVAYPEVFGNYRAEDFFSDAFNAANIVDNVRSCQYTIDELNAQISSACGATMHGMLSDSAKNADSHLRQCLGKALGMSDLTRDWSPEAEIWFFHNTDDDVVPYLNTISCYNAFKESAKGKVSLYTTGIGMSHTAAAIDFMARMILGNYK